MKTILDWLNASTGVPHWNVITLCIYWYFYGRWAQKHRVA